MPTSFPFVRQEGFARSGRQSLQSMYHMFKLIKIAGIYGIYYRYREYTQITINANWPQRKKGKREFLIRI